MPSAKKRTGGRVTPKGTQPPASKHKASGDGSGTTRATPGRIDPTAGRASFGPINPTRSGHNRGNR